MPPARLAIIAGLFIAAVGSAAAVSPAAAASPAAGAERDRCLSPDERRAKIASRQVVPLARAIRASKARRPEVVRASLCERDGKLVYLLTVLLRDGKVARVTVDAGSGTVISRH
jgi:uncharacterized membrane protein YkoI